MKRKINRVGVSTLTVSLPSKWAKQQGLKAGDEVDVGEEGSKLLINVKDIKIEQKRVTIHLKAGQPLLRRYLTVMYKDGFDEIEITSESPIDKSILKDAINAMLGFELVEAHPNRIVVRNVATPNESEFGNIFNRLFLLILTIAKSVLEDLKTGKCNNFNEVSELELTTNKFYCFCQRVLIKRDAETRSKTMNLYLFTSMLENAADDLRQMSKILCSEKIKISKPIMEVFENCIKYIGAVFECFSKPEILKVYNIKKQRDLLIENIYSLFNKKNIGISEFKIVILIFSLVTNIKNIETEIYHL